MISLYSYFTQLLAAISSFRLHPTCPNHLNLSSLVFTTMFVTPELPPIYSFIILYDQITSHTPTLTFLFLPLPSLLPLSYLTPPKLTYIHGTFLYIFFFLLLATLSGYKVIIILLITFSTFSLIPSHDLL